MPYPVHWRVTFGGPFWTTDEWSCSLRIGKADLNVFQQPTGPGYDNLDGPAALTDVAADVAKFHAASTSLFSNQAKLGFVKFNRIGSDGRYVDQSRTREKRYSPTVSPSTTSAGIPQVAIAVTLRSDRDRGPLSRGRFFIPTGATPTDAGSPLLSTLGATNLATSVATLIRDLNNWAGLDTNGAGVILVSPGGRGLPDGGSAPVTRVEVGRVFDTQRRRRSSLQEQPVSVTV